METSLQREAFEYVLKHDGDSLLQELRSQPELTHKRTLVTVYTVGREDGTVVHMWM